MTFQSRLSALLGLAILSLCNIALVNAGDENTVYAIHANLCKYGKRRKWLGGTYVTLDKGPTQVVEVPVGGKCAIHYNTTKKQWACRATNDDITPAKGTAITILRGTKDPDSGKTVKKVSKKNKNGEAAYIVADTDANCRLVWSNTGYAVISQPDNTHEIICITNGSLHPRVFGRTLSLQASVGLRTKGGLLTEGEFVEHYPSDNLAVDVANRSPSEYPPVYELKYEGDFDKNGKWTVKQYYGGDVHSDDIKTRGIAIVARGIKNKIAHYRLVKAERWPPAAGKKRPVAYILPEKQTKVSLTSNTAEIYHTEKTGGNISADKKKGNEVQYVAININLGNLSTPVMEYPIRLPTLTALSHFPTNEAPPSWFDATKMDDSALADYQTKHEKGVSRRHGGEKGIELSERPRLNSTGSDDSEDVSAGEWAAQNLYYGTFSSSLRKFGYHDFDSEDSSSSRSSPVAPEEAS